MTKPPKYNYFWFGHFFACLFAFVLFFTFFKWDFDWFLISGGTPAQSLTNLKEWLDAFTLRHCNSRCLVKVDGHRVHGLFDHMMKGEHENFERYLSYMGEWAQCQTGNISGGWYFSVVASGCGEMQYTHKKLGAFQ